MGGEKKKTEREKSECKKMECEKMGYEKMECEKLFDSELKVMEVLWDEGDATAKHVAERLGKEIGWNKNTTYTLIKRCIAKGAVERREPGYICHALVFREQVQRAETDELIQKLYAGSVDKLFAALLGRQELSSEQIGRLKHIVDELQ